MRYDEIMNSNFLADAKRRTKQSIWVLAAVGAVNFLFALWYYFGKQDAIAALVQAVIALIFAGLALYASKQPYKAIISGTVFYILLIALLAAVDISTLFQGIILKVFIVAALIKGIKAAQEVKELEQKLAGSRTVK